MILEELNFLARHKFESIKEVEEYKSDLESKLPQLKGEREDLWRKYNKTTNEENKATIKNEINELTEKIDTIQAHKNACIRIIDKYAIIKEEYKKQVEDREKTQELIRIDKKKKTRNR